MTKPGELANPTGKLPPTTKITLGEHLGHCALTVLTVAAVLFTVAFGFVGIIQAWNHLPWAAALAITLGAVSLVLGVIGYVAGA